MSFWTQRRTCFFLQSGSKNEQQILRFAQDDKIIFDDVSISAIVILVVTPSAVTNPHPTSSVSAVSTWLGSSPLSAMSSS